MTIRKCCTLILLVSTNLLVVVLFFHTKDPSEEVLQSNYLSTLNEEDSEKESEHQKLLESPIYPTIRDHYVSTTSSPISGMIFEIFPHPYDYVISNRRLCSDVKSDLSVLVLVATAVSNFDSRQSIRNTWGSVALVQSNFISPSVVRMGFLLGATRNSSLQALVEEEQAIHGDIIQEDFLDSYQNLTLKSVMLLKWVTDFCPNVKFVLKTDDDMYVNIDKLLTTLAPWTGKKNVMYGSLFHRATPDRNTRAKWYVSRKQFARDVFPDYLSGTGYVISRDVIPKLLQVSHRIPFMVMEDIFITGLCAQAAGVRRINLGGFTYLKRLSTGCAFKDAITGHRITIEERLKIWNELQNPKLVCSARRRGGIF